MGRAPCCDKANVKKGPWSPEEDAKLKEFIDKFGTGGNWIALPQKAGLKRCGKSCRLRWLNYLRPNIKHGEFSDEEDRIICTLYASIGSRWSIIAAQLPGRTDNDIKNYWNTKLKKKLTGMIPSSNNNHGKYLPPFSFNLQSHNSLSSLSQLYNSLYTQATKSHSSNNNIEYSSLSAPQNFLHNHPPLFSCNYQPSQQSNLVNDLQHYHHVKDNNMLVFGGNEASCSSSDGSCGQISYGKDHVMKKQEDQMGFYNQGFISNNHGLMEENQRFMLHYGTSILENQKPNGVLETNNSQLEYDLEEVKQLITSGNGNINFLLSDENNSTHERGMYYY